MMKNLAKVALVEILPTHRAMLEMPRLGLDWAVVVFARVARSFVVGPISHFRSLNTLAASIRAS
jgi:hypothetical protein